jgi:hypothetical protein
MQCQNTAKIRQARIKLIKRFLSQRISHLESSIIRIKSPRKINKNVLKRLSKWILTHNIRNIRNNKVF